VLADLPGIASQPTKTIPDDPKPVEFGDICGVLMLTPFGRLLRGFRRDDEIPEAAGQSKSEIDAARPSIDPLKQVICGIGQIDFPAGDRGPIAGHHTSEMASAP